MPNNENVEQQLKDQVARIWAAAAARAADFEPRRDASSTGRTPDQVDKGEIIPFFARFVASLGALREAGPRPREAPGRLERTRRHCL
jgi:hypothetical protein